MVEEVACWLDPPPVAGAHRDLRLRHFRHINRQGSGCGARVLCASAPLPEPRVLFLWPGPHRQLRPLRVSPRQAVQARQAARSTGLSLAGL